MAGTERPMRIEKGGNSFQHLITNIPSDMEDDGTRMNLLIETDGDVIISLVRELTDEDALKLIAELQRGSRRISQKVEINTSLGGTHTPGLALAFVRAIRAFADR